MPAVRIGVLSAFCGKVHVKLAIVPVGYEHVLPSIVTVTLVISSVKLVGFVRPIVTVLPLSESAVSVGTDSMKV